MTRGKLREHILKGGCARCEVLVVTYRFTDGFLTCEFPTDNVIFSFFESRETTKCCLRSVLCTVRTGDTVHATNSTFSLSTSQIPQKSNVQKCFKVLFGFIYSPFYRGVLRHTYVTLRVRLIVRYSFNVISLTGGFVFSFLSLSRSKAQHFDAVQLTALHCIQLHHSIYLLTMLFDIFKYRQIKFN